MSKELQKAMAELDRLQKENKEQAKQWEAERAREKKLENLPPDIILRARELSHQGKFRRLIVKRTPKNYDWDSLELECGHTTATMRCNPSDSNSRECQECIETWLLRDHKKSPAKRAKKAK